MSTIKYNISDKWDEEDGLYHDMDGMDSTDTPPYECTTQIELLRAAMRPYTEFWEVGSIKGVGSLCRRIGSNKEYLTLPVRSKPESDL
jgi:hypothetical protein